MRVDSFFKLTSAKFICYVLELIVSPHVGIDASHRPLPLERIVRLH